MRTTLLLAALTLLPAVAFAQAADLLFSARTLTCEWGQGTTANWDDGSQPSLEQVSFGARTSKSASCFWPARQRGYQRADQMIDSVVV